MQSIIKYDVIMSLHYNPTDILMLGLATKCATCIVLQYLMDFQGVRYHKMHHRAESGGTRDRCLRFLTAKFLMSIPCKFVGNVPEEEYLG